MAPSCIQNKIQTTLPYLQVPLFTLPTSQALLCSRLFLFAMFCNGWNILPPALCRTAFSHHSVQMSILWRWLSFLTNLNKCITAQPPSTCWVYNSFSFMTSSFVFFRIYITNSYVLLYMCVYHLLHLLRSLSSLLLYLQGLETVLCS